MSKILANRQNHLISIQQKEINQTAEKLNTASDLIQTITNGELLEADLEELNEYIGFKSGFRLNLMASADLLAVKDEYLKVKEILTAISIEEIKKFHYAKGIYSVSNKQKQDIEDKDSTYLEGAKLKIYNKLTRIADIYNDINNINYANAVVRRPGTSHQFKVNPFLILTVR